MYWQNICACIIHRNYCRRMESKMDTINFFKCEIPSFVEQNIFIPDFFHWRCWITFGDHYCNDGKVAKMEENLGYSKWSSDSNTFLYFSIKSLCTENNELPHLKVTFIQIYLLFLMQSKILVTFFFFCQECKAEIFLIKGICRFYYVIVGEMVTHSKMKLSMYQSNSHSNHWCLFGTAYSFDKEMWISKITHKLYCLKIQEFVLHVWERII